MKYFIAISLLVAVASAGLVKPVGSELAELQEIIAAINSPSTDPATAAALEEMLLDALGVKPEPVEVGPAVIDTHPISVGPAIIESNPISVGPALIDFPLPDAGVVAEEPIVPTPVIVAPAPVDEVTPVAAAAPLVQIILNINQAAADVSPVAVGPAVEPTPVHVVESAPEPVHVVEVAPEPVQVVETAPEPVQVVETAPEPVQVVETAPVPAEPVVIGVPILPEAVVALPEALN
ncbi:calphotin-like isoform X10 [Spodoptera frugiperda]|uniref:Calphotin-like isoform X10 n=1 Tax=Spodoptera frugiperda TaxID=7108 RepID=A0A9R0DPS7_SPOFR|nr:calphotin-like isoform X10 [Spodoptera frugiperda]